MSPIRGLTEKVRIPRIGKVHLGYMLEKSRPDGSKYTFPTAADHFVFPKAHPQYEEVVKVFGEKPRELNIAFLSDDDQVVASQYYRCYSKTRGLLCKGDGVNANRLVDLDNPPQMATAESKSVDMVTITCAGRDCPDYGKKCRELMNLQFMLPQIAGLGVWQLDTSSVYSIMTINGALGVVRRVYKRISMVPLILGLVQIQVRNPEDGKLKKVWTLELRSKDNMVQAAMKANMKPLELVTGVGEDVIPDEVLELPRGDDQRPPLVTPDYEPGADQSPPVPPAEAPPVVQEGPEKAEKPAEAAIPGRVKPGPGPKPGRTPAAKRPRPAKAPPAPAAGPVAQAARAPAPVVTTPAPAAATSPEGAAAIEAAFEVIARARAENPPAGEPKSIIDLEWFKESLGKLQVAGLEAFSNNSFLKYLNQLTAGKFARPSEALAHLTREQAETVVKRIQDALEMI